jgi:hypothetical protein
LKLGNHPGPNPGLPHAFFSTNGSVNRKKNGTKGKNVKRRGAGLKKRRIEENWRSMHGNRSVHIGDAHSLDIAGTRV